MFTIPIRRDFTQFIFSGTNYFDATRCIIGTSKYLAQKKKTIIVRNTNLIWCLLDCLFCLSKLLLLLLGMCTDVIEPVRTWHVKFGHVRTGSNAGNYKNHAPRVKAVVRRSKRKQHLSGLWLIDWAKGEQYESGSWLIVVNA